MPINAEKMMKLCYYLNEKICWLTPVKQDKSFRLGKAILFQRTRIYFEKQPERWCHAVVNIIAPFNKTLTQSALTVVPAAG